MVAEIGGGPGVCSSLLCPRCRQFLGGLGPANLAGHVVLLAIAIQAFIALRGIRQEPEARLDAKGRRSAWRQYRALLVALLLLTLFMAGQVEREAHTYGLPLIATVFVLCLVGAAWSVAAVAASTWWQSHPGRTWIVAPALIAFFLLDGVIVSVEAGLKSSG